MVARPPLLLLFLALAMALVASADADAAKKKPKPSVKVMGISVNRVFLARGDKVELDDGTNDCYIIGGGPSGVPPQLVAYAYVRAVRVPASAPMTYEFKTPWDRAAGGATDSLFSGPFSKGLFKAFGKQQAALYNGPTTKKDHFTYRMLPQPSPTSLYISGTYSMTVSVKVSGKTLKSSVSVPVAC
jgi:hypothetical protein